MNFRELEQQFINETSGLFDVDESKSCFYLAVEHFEGWTRSYLLLNKDKELNSEKKNSYIEVINDLKNNKPIQYIFASTLFYGLKFKVGPAVLIPRPETEELVDWILNILPKDKTITQAVLDVGTGSGCIAITLKKNLKNTEVSALDISEEALAIAAENAVSNDTDILFIKADILDYKGKDTYDLIVSNPPYIKENERPAMHNNVLAHEPHLALFVADEKPLIFYEAIADFALAHLNPDGKLFFEINEYLAKEMTEMLHQKGFSSVILKADMQGKDRMMYCQF